MVSVPLLSFFIAPQMKPLDMEYFQLEAGSELFYNTTENSDTWETKRYIDDSYEIINGIFGVFTVFWCEAHKYPGDSDYSWVNQMWLSKSGNSLIWWGFEDQNTKVIAHNGLTYVTEPVIAGANNYGLTLATLTIKGSSQVMDVNFEGNYTIDAVESVTVPAGTFNECIKVHEQEITPDGTIDFYVWYSKDVGGAVKYDYHQNNRTDVLTSYHMTTENDPWNNWLIPYLPTMLLWTISSSIIGVVAIIALIIVNKRLIKREA
ncbi:MAG: hypothetical protein GF317_21130 [Candidatus Lokiarchaeota archaeon]|nr:hypothetical protein [Candidatus Lokiarchaeota archaeon]